MGQQLPALDRLGLGGALLVVASIVGYFLSRRVKSDAANTSKVYQSLLQHGVIVRPLGIYEMPNHLRVTVGLESQNKRFLESLEQALSELN
mgnify:CR=1 FL=1